MSPSKPGIQTSEFWVTMVTNIMAVINLFHPLVVGDSVINTLASILAMICVTISYNQTRKDIKIAAIKTETVTTTIVTPAATVTEMPKP